MRGELEDWVRQRKLENIRFLGFLSSAALREVIRNAKLIVLPSEWYENNPYSVIEAFAYGKMVLGSRIGGIPELVQDGKTGLTYTPGDVGDLRTKIEYLFEHTADVIQMGRRARDYAERILGKDVHFSSLMKIYEEQVVRRA